ncbi:hypothetical protein CC2G_001711 [Coprinopsis cinerea AmutBmut pab1-1]|nr:hypothetical protein CC2G_001711 [Coprinopsis cinerea AmutBmut pab1-1]
MANFTSLPPELVFQILSYLPIPSIVAVQQVSGGLNQLFKEGSGDNERSIYKRAAWLHGLANPKIELQNLATFYSGQSLKGLEGEALTWKDFCKRRVEVNRSWAGTLPSDVKRYHPPPNHRSGPAEGLWSSVPKDVHRIKVDETRGFFLTTTRGGSIVVSEISTGRSLWSLPRVYVRPYAHLEYENGYIVFDRFDGKKEVWRLQVIPPVDIEADCAIDEGQNAVASMMQQIWSMITPHTMPPPPPLFVPHLLIPVPVWNNVPDHTRAYRLVYPYLLSASATRAYIWDVRTGKRVQVVENIQDVLLDGETKNVPTGSYDGERWWNDSPSLISDHDNGDSDEEEEEPEFEFAPAISLSGFNIAAADDDNGSPGSDLDIEDDNLSQHIDRALEYASKPMNVDPGQIASTSSTTIEENTNVFPQYPPFTSGFFDETALFSDPPTRSEAIQGIETFDPLSLSTDAPKSLGTISYVELGKRWVFIVGKDELRVFKRGNIGEPNDEDSEDEPFAIAPGHLALRLPANRDRYGRWVGQLGSSSVREHPESELVRQEVVWKYRESEEPVESGNVCRDGVKISTLGGKRRKRVWDKFIAAHISPNQQHLVILTASSRIIYIPFFERVIYRQARLYDVALELQLGDPRNESVYLAYGCKGNARISAVTRGGLFVITPYFLSEADSTVSNTNRDPGPSSSCQRPPPQRHVQFTVCRVTPFFNDPERLSQVSCLQMSDTGLWLNWARGILPHAGVAPDTDEEEDAMYSTELLQKYGVGRDRNDSEDDEEEFGGETDQLLEDGDELTPHGDGHHQGTGRRRMPGAFFEPRRSDDETLDRSIQQKRRAEKRKRWDSAEASVKGSKYAWKPETRRSYRDQARMLFEEMFVDGLKQGRKVQLNHRGEGMIVTGHRAAYLDPETVFQDYSEVHQIRFVP